VGLSAYASIREDSCAGPQSRFSGTPLTSWIVPAAVALAFVPTEMSGTSAMIFLGYIMALGRVTMGVTIAMVSPLLLRSSIEKSRSLALRHDGACFGIDPRLVYDSLPNGSNLGFQEPDPWAQTAQTVGQHPEKIL
jgi:hypothetical protein